MQTSCWPVPNYHVGTNASSQHPFVSHAQGRPDNPFINRDTNPGYTCEVEPPKIAMRLMRTREQLAGEWGDALNLLVRIRITLGVGRNRQRTLGSAV